MDVAELTTLADLARADLPGWLSLQVADAGTAQPPLFAEEEAAVSRAVGKRRAEFAAGRAAARAALANYGAAPGPIPVGPDRAPVWPQGFCGSITHTGTLCAALVAETRDARAVGIDLEMMQELEPGVRNIVASPAELAELAQDPNGAAARIFSAKEAAYKAQYPLGRTLFGFDGLVYSAQPDGSAQLQFTRDIAPFSWGDGLRVQQWCHAGLIFSVCLLLPTGPGRM